MTQCSFLFNQSIRKATISFTKLSSAKHELEFDTQPLCESNQSNIWFEKETLCNILKLSFWKLRTFSSMRNVLGIILVLILFNHFSFSLDERYYFWNPLAFLCKCHKLNKFSLPSSPWNDQLFTNFIFYDAMSHFGKNVEVYSINFRLVDGEIFLKNDSRSK